jgi:hypothetical protein
MATTHSWTAQAAAATVATANLTVRRGQESWNYFRFLLSVALTIEGSVVPMITPLRFPWNVGLVIGAMAITCSLFLYNGWVHNKLLGWKNYYENRPH